MDTIRRVASSSRLQFVATVLLLVGLASSYWPRLDFGMADGLNLKLPLSIILAALFVVLSLPAVYRQRQLLMRSPALRWFGLLIVIAAISLAWTPNLLRGASEVGLLCGLYVVFTAVQAQLHDGLFSRYKRQLITGTWLIVAAVCVLALWQLFGEAYGVSASYTLLPEVYQSQVFGFARPTGFALEPEFLASLLLAPMLVLAWWQLGGRSRLVHRLLLLLVLTTIGLTLSRGAYIASAIGLIILLSTVQASWKARGQIVAMVIISGAVALGLMTAAAQINQRDNISGQAALAGSVNHLSLGTISLPDGAQSSDSIAAPASGGKSAHVTETPGYVEESTSSRLSMTSEALLLWAKTPTTALFGIGQGGFGAALHEAKPEHSVASIVNNQYIQTLAELGLVGLIVLIALLGLPVYRLGVRGKWLGVAILAALYAQWLFFSGSINVIHLWVVLAMCYVYSHTK